MKYLLLPLLVVALLWIISIAWFNRRKSPGDNHSGGDGGSGDSGGSFSSSSCDSSDGGCGGGDGGGGD